MPGFKRYPNIKQTDKIFPDVSISDREEDLYIMYNIEDRLENIAWRVYGDPALWWIILLANPEYTNEFEIPPGETIRIPLPINSIVDEIKAQLK